MKDVLLGKCLNYTSPSTIMKNRILKGVRCMKQNIFSLLPAALLPWYAENKRDLPWRRDHEPYHIWLSEIMLQQTRVEAVKGYYGRFLQALPTIETLANVDDELLHKLWEGLGYYSRVRNLKKAAQMIIEKHDGVFPGEYAQVLALPGIGEYTAGAICSIAFNQRTPAVDGNVLRLAARLTDDHTPIGNPAFKKQVRQALAEVYPRQAGDFTQALMELGATLCGPNTAPQCHACPCRPFCLGHKNGTAEQLPVKEAKAPRRQEEKTVFIFSCNGRYALCKREETGLLAGLWQFPNREGKLTVEDAISFVEGMGLKPVEILRIVERKHIFTHVEWDMSGIYMEIREENDRYTWLTGEQIRQQAALPTAFRKFWQELEQEEA